MNNDRLAFKTVRLKNGITVYAKPWDVPFADVRLYFPIGHLHNTGDIPPGSAHYLEHLVCKRSEVFPSTDGFDREIAARGGTFYASTKSTWTRYDIEVPSEHFNDLFRTFIAHLTTPTLREDDIALEASVITNERMRYSKWYPGTSRLEQYCSLGWMHDLLPARQRLGDSNDHERMTPALLRRLHRMYFDERTHVFVGGTFDLNVVCDVLSRIRTTHNDLPLLFDQVRWNRQTYHEVACAEGKRPIYHIGGIVPERDIRVRIGMKIIGAMLTDQTHGTLYQWLRRELGWAYNMGFTFTRLEPPYYDTWELWMPCKTAFEARHARMGLHEKIRDTITRRDLLQELLRYRTNRKVFLYQTIASILTEASVNVHTHGHIFTESDMEEVIRDVAHPKVLQRLYEQYWSPEVSGEFLALPEAA